MAQLSILHQNRGVRAGVHRDTASLVHCPILHAQTSAIKVGQSIHLRGAGIENFLGCSRSPGTGCIQQFIQVLLRVLTGEDNVTLLPGITIIGIQIHRGIGVDIYGIPELDAPARCGRKRDDTFSTTSGIDTAQAVGTVRYLCILLKED